MRRLALLILALLFPLAALGQTPAIVHVSGCPNSRDNGGSVNGNYYTCPLADPTIAGNTLIVWFAHDNSGSNNVWTVKDDAGNSLTDDGDSSTSPNGNMGHVYRESNVAAGLNYVKITNTSGGTNGYINPVVLEVSNVTASSPLDHFWCGSGSTTTVSVGASGTLGASGDLILQFSYPDTLASQTANWTAGTGSSPTWKLLLNNYYDGYAAQYGVYSSTSTVTPSMTQAAANPYLTCAAAYRAGSSGGSPTGTYPISIMHDNDPTGSRQASPWLAGIVSYGNAVLIAANTFNTQISSITSSPSCPGPGWVSLGAPTTNSSITQYWWCPNSSFNGPVKLTYNLTAATDNDTFMVYDLQGSSWTADKIQGETGNQTSGMTSITTCTSCMTPSSSGEMLFGIYGQNNCTAISTTGPSGSHFDTANGTITNVDGPQPLDENNGWWHLNSGPGTAISSGYNLRCGTQPPDEWSAQFAAIHSAASVPTYYVSYSTGSDSNSGTSTASPWKHFPGMKGLTPAGASTGDGCTGVCASTTLSAGNRVIGKGGDVWPYTTAPWDFSASGSSSSQSYGCAGPGCIYVGSAVGAGLPAWNNGTVTGIWISKDYGGWSPSSPPTISCSGGGGSGAAATASVVPAASSADPNILTMLYNVAMTSGGSGYTSAPTCTLSGGGVGTLGTDIDRPIFDLGATQGSPPDWPIGQCGSFPTTCNPGLNLQGTYLLFNGIEVRNMRYQQNTFGGTNDEHTDMVLMNSQHETVTNFYTHGMFEDCFYSGGTCSTAADMQWDGIGDQNAFQEVSFNVVENGDAAFLGNSTQAGHNVCTTNAMCTHASFGIANQTQTGFGPDSVHDNKVYGNFWQLRFVGNNVSGSLPYLSYNNDFWLTLYAINPTSHINARYMQLASSASLISWDNYVHNEVGGTSSQQECPSGVSYTYYNEVSWAMGIGTPVYGLDMNDVGGTGGCALNLYNDTMYDSNNDGACVNSQAGSNTTNIVMQNLQCIEGSTAPNPFWGTASGSVYKNSAGSSAVANVQAASTVQSTTTATSQGYVYTNAIAPTSSGNDTVTFASGGGTANLTSLCTGNLTALCNSIDGIARPTTGGWQAGAHMFSGGLTYSWTVTAINGTVTGTNCASGAYASGTTIGPCTATPNTGYSFTSWSGVSGSAACSGSTNPCSSFSITSSSAATATFTINSYTLSTSTSGTGSGTITGCAGSRNYGAAYTCTITPNAGSILASATGCGGSGTTSYTGTMPASNCTVTATFNQIAATPTFSPPAGSYGPAQTVTISSTAGATICYTIDGSTPTANGSGTCTHGTTYTSAITVSTSETVKSIGSESGYVDSAVGSAAYVINGAAATPTFSPSSLSAPGWITISSSTSGSTCYYSVDGSTPTTSSAQYYFHIRVGQSQTLKAICSATGYTNSAVGSQAYSFAAPKTRFSLSRSATSQTPSPFPQDDRSCCQTGLGGTFVYTIEPTRGTYDWAYFNSWRAQDASNGSTFTFTYQGFPTWMTGQGSAVNYPPTDLNTTATCQAPLAGVITTDCSIKEFTTALAQDVTGLSSAPGAPVNCPNLDYIEPMNEFNTDSSNAFVGWTGTYAQLATMANDIATIVHTYCLNTQMLLGSTSSLPGFHSNGAAGDYDAATLAVAQLVTPNLFNGVSFHNYSSAYSSGTGSVSPTPFPTTLASHSDSTCTTGNTPNSKCYVAELSQVSNMKGTTVLQNSAIKPFAGNWPVYLTEGGYGQVAQLNGGASGQATSFAITSNVATIQMINNSFSIGETLLLQNFSTADYFNGQTVTVLSTGLSGSQFEFNFTHADVGSTSDTGVAVDAVTTDALRIAWVAEFKLLTACQNPVDDMMYLAFDTSAAEWGVYQGSPTVAWNQAYNQTDTWLASVVLPTSCTATSTAVSGGNVWTILTFGGDSEFIWYDGWYPATYTQSTSYTGQQNIQGTTSGTGGSVTLTQTPLILFNTTTYTLSTAAGGTGSGTVSCTPSGSGITSGTPYSCSVTPATGSTLTSVTGCGGSGTTTYAGTMPASNCTVSATFTINTYTWAPTIVGSGTVTGTNSTGGSYNYNTTIGPLTANAATGYTFTGWSSVSGSAACSGSTNPCPSFSLTSNSAATATFTINSYALTFATAGTGSGSISGSNCTTASYNYGTSVSCTATPSGGSTFAGWSGLCTGTGSCTFSVSAAGTVTAAFNIITAPSLTLSGKIMVGGQIQ